MNHDHERGQALVEFAIASLAALTMFFGIIDFARALYTDHLVTNGARLATRYAMVNSVAACAGGNPDPLQAYVLAQSPGLTSSLLTVTTACPGGNAGCTSHRRVLVSLRRAVRLVADDPVHEQLADGDVAIAWSASRTSPPGCSRR